MTDHAEAEDQEVNPIELSDQDNDVIRVLLAATAPSSGALSGTGGAASASTAGLPKLPPEALPPAPQASEIELAPLATDPRRKSQA